MNKDHSTRWMRFNDICQRLGRNPMVRAFEIVRATDALETPAEGDTSRSIIFTLSTPGIKRDGHQVRQEGWHLANYRNNPVVMWAHSRDQLPIANSAWERLVNSPANGGKVLRSQANFLTADLNPFAEQVLKLYKTRSLNAVSAGWMPLEYDFMRDENGYIQGIDFKRQDMLEYSGCPIPADPNALQRCFKEGTIRADQINDFSMSPLLNSEEVKAGEVFYIGLHDEPEREAKIIVDMSANTLPETRREEATPEAAVETPEEEILRAVVPYVDHPLQDKGTTWNASAAKKRAEEFAKLDSGVDGKKYRQFFLYYDESKPEVTASYKGPHHDIIDGKIVTNLRGVYAAAQRLQQGAFDVPVGDLPGMRNHIAKHYAQNGEKAPWERASGQMYERIHQELQSITEETERDALRASAEGLATQLYGETRLPEPWQNRYVRLGEKSVWPKAAGEVEGVLRSLVVDAEALEDFVEAVIERLFPVFQMHENAVALVRDLFILTETKSGEELVDAIKKVRATPEQTPEPEVNAEATAISEALEKVNRLLDEPIVGGEIGDQTATTEKSENSSETLLTIDEELRTLLTDIVNFSPAAGSEGSNNTEETKDSE